MASLVPFSKKRLTYAIKFAGWSVNSVAKKILFSPSNQEERILRRYLQKERMPEETLADISKLLNVSGKYLTGEWNEKAPEYVSVSNLISALQGDDIIAKRTDPDGVYILPADEEKTDILLSEAIMQTRHYVNGTLRKYNDSGKWIFYSSLFDTQHYLELFRIFEKIVQIAAAQEIAYHPDHISLGAIIKQIESEPAKTITVNFE